MNLNRLRQPYPTLYYTSRQDAPPLTIRTESVVKEKCQTSGIGVSLIYNWLFDPLTITA